MFEKYINELRIKSYMLLDKNKHLLSKQQYRSLKGQIKSNNFDSVIAGINKIRSNKYVKIDK